MRKVKPKNLVILGNGFDLAHGIKSDYSSFIKYLVNLQISTPTLSPSLFTLDSKINTYQDVVEYLKKSRIENTFEKSDYGFQNLFLKRVLSKVSSTVNWCNIEEEYFDYLKEISRTNDINNNNNLFQLNSEFEIIKKYLEKYIFDEWTKDKKIIKSYQHFFNELNVDLDHLILNFNYTKTYSRYGVKYNVVNIHGELNSIENPIIFGYAALDQESRDLINLGENEYMRNIKKHCYKWSRNERELRAFLDSGFKIRVSILGHSCGISDKLILNDIFNHENIEEIFVFYYEEREKYVDTMVNIDRIMNNDSNFKKLRDCQSSFRMPQVEDSEELIKDFEKFISSNF